MRTKVPEPSLANNRIFVLATTARLPLSAGLDEVRQLEYIYGLSWIAARRLPAAVVMSETTQPWPEVERLPWKLKLRFTSQHKSKSAKEADSLRELVASLQKTNLLSNDTMVYKLSGRYQVVRDEALTAAEDPNVDMVCRHGSLGQTFTFFFGMRWKYFQDFFLAVDLQSLETENVERAISDFAQQAGLRVKVMPRLWVVANIANGGEYAVY
jgi:hypothetical protein